MSNTTNPFMVEFTGVAEAGKTTCVKTLLEQFQNLNLKVHYIRESAEIVKFDSWDGPYVPHLSMRLITINEILTNKYAGYDLILIDRGLIDGILFTEHLKKRQPEISDDCDALISFIESLKHLLSPDLLVVFKVSPDVSIARKGGEGHLVTHKFVEEQNQIIDSFINRIDVPFHVLDTSYSSKEDVANEVFNLISNKMKDH